MTSLTMDKTVGFVRDNPACNSDFIPAFSFNIPTIEGVAKKTLVYKMSSLRREVYVDFIVFSNLKISDDITNLKIYHINAEGRAVCVFGAEKFGSLRHYPQPRFDLGFWGLRPDDKIVVEYEGSSAFGFELHLTNSYTHKAFYNTHQFDLVEGLRTYYVRNFDKLEVYNPFVLNDGLEAGDHFIPVANSTYRYLVYESSSFCAVRSFDIKPVEDVDYCLVHTERSVFNVNNVRTMLGVMRNLRRDIMYSEKENFENEVYRHILGRGIKFQEVSNIIDNYQLFLNNTPHLGTFCNYKVPELTALDTEEADSSGGSDGSSVTPAIT